jgi:hypothetical protein
MRKKKRSRSVVKEIHQLLSVRGITFSLGARKAA